MPGERATIIIDFKGLRPGMTAILQNSAKTPYPNGATVNGRTTGRVMQFRLVPLTAADTSYDPATGAPLRTPMVRLADPATGTVAPGVVVNKTRQLTLNEVMGMPVTVGGIKYPGGPLEILVNNSKYRGDSSRNDPGGYQDFTLINVNGVATYYSELPQEGETELWEIINLTADAHPMHPHLAQVQIVSRQAFDVKGYLAAYALAYGGVVKDAWGPPLNYNTPNADGALGGNPAVTPFLKGKVQPPPANEAGWKDTVRSMPARSRASWCVLHRPICRRPRRRPMPTIRSTRTTATGMCGTATSWTRRQRDDAPVLSPIESQRAKPAAISGWRH